MAEAASHPLYQALLRSMQAEKARPFIQWSPSKITPADLQFIKKQCDKNEFDRLNLRNTMYEAFAEGKAQIFAQESDVARIIILTDRATEAADPALLQIWGRLIRTFGSSIMKGDDADPYTIKPQIIWFASRHIRFWPPRDQPVSHEHINGGYCMVCDPGTIVIYRYEDATRVLIHELLHGFCTDDPMTATHTVEHIETHTEAWAELILAAAREVGLAAPQPLPNALNAQLEWIALQNERLRREHRVLTPADYAWRYTVGKEAVLRTMGFIPYSKKYREVSMRLTPPISPNMAL